MRKTLNTMSLQHPARLALAAAALAAGLLAGPAHAADVGVSIQIAQPGAYGRIDIGRFPQPVVVTPQPVYVPAPRPVYTPGAVVVAPVVEPVYLWVPPGHQRHWRQECWRYRACGVPVHFVDDRWYREHVLPERGHGRGPGREHEHEHERDHDHEHDERGHGHGRD